MSCKLFATTFWIVMLRNLVLLLSIFSFVLGGATFSHAAEMNGDVHAGSAQNLETSNVHDHHDGHHHHGDESGSDEIGGSSMHCGAPVLGMELVVFSFGVTPRDVHEQVPAAEFVGQSYALDPPPPRFLFS